MMARAADEKQGDLLLLLDNPTLQVFHFLGQAIGDFINLFVNAGRAGSGADAICFTLASGLGADGIDIFLEGLNSAGEVILNNGELGIGGLGSFAHGIVTELEERIGQTHNKPGAGEPGGDVDGNDFIHGSLRVQAEKSRTQFARNQEIV